MLMYQDKQLSDEEANLILAYQRQCIYREGHFFGPKEVLAWCDAFPEEAAKLGLINVDMLMERFREMSALMLKVINSKVEGDKHGN